MGRGNVRMSGAVLLVFAVSSLAGTFLRVWAFAFASVCFGLVVLAMSILEGEPLVRSLIFCVKLLVLMQVSYVLGLFLRYFASQIMLRFRRRPLVDSTRMGGEPPSS